MSGKHGEGVDDMEMTVHPLIDTWLAGHPYLAGIATFQRSIEDVLCSHEPAIIAPPHWENFTEGFSEGTPVLETRPLDKAVFAQAGKVLISVLERMSEIENPDEIKNACTLLCEELQRSPDAAALLVEHMVANREMGLPDTRVNPGFVRFICWRTLETVLRPWVQSFAQWRSDDMWSRPYCPFCGSHPAMSQLARTKKGRERFLSCGCCKSRWSYHRTRCPFCGNYDQEKLEILELEREEPFRLDVCRDCNGYLKTYIGEGSEKFLLSDWSTLHLDILARQEGLQRRADSLYEL